MRPLEQVSVQLRGTRAVTHARYRSATTRPTSRDCAIRPMQALAAARGQPANLATIADSWHSMKLVADIFRPDMMDVSFRHPIGS